MAFLFLCPFLCFSIANFSFIEIFTLILELVATNINYIFSALDIVQKS